MKPIKLTLAQVKEAGRKAYLEERLSAQGPTPDCAYRDFSGLPCVIGAAMTDAEAINVCGDIGWLVTEGKVECPEADLAGLKALQAAHDRWAENVEWADGNPSVQADCADAEAELRKLLDIEDSPPASSEMERGR